MSLGEGARGLMALRFGPPGPEAYRGALLLSAALLGLRPEFAELVVGTGEESPGPLPW